MRGEIDLDRYARQIILPEIGERGQELLARAAVLIVGMGALGTTQASLLTRAGVGRIVVADRDTIELNNLQRQILFEESDVGNPKALVAKDRLKGINDGIDIQAEVVDFNFSNAEELVAPVDLVIDATDNMDTRYLINDVCLKLRKPWIYGGAVGTYGMVLAFIPDGPCFRCIFPNPPNAGDLPTCDTAGVLNSLPTVVAALQVTEAFKILTGQRPAERLLSVDVWTHECREVTIAKDPACPACSAGKLDFLNPEKKKLYASICGRNAVQIIPERRQKLSLKHLADRLGTAGAINLKKGVLFFRAGEHELTIFEDGRTIVKGTNDPVKAKSLFSRFIGD